MRKLNLVLYLAISVAMVSGNFCFATSKSTYGPPSSAYGPPTSIPQYGPPTSMPQVQGGSMLEQFRSMGMSDDQIRQMLTQQGMTETMINQMFGAQSAEPSQPEELSSSTPTIIAPVDSLDEQPSETETVTEQPETFQTFDEFIEFMTRSISTKYADKLTPEIIKQVLPEIEAMSSKINNNILKQEINIDGFLSSASETAMSNLPSEEVIASIPDENIEMARATSYASIDQSIEQGFASSINTANQEVSRIVETVIPKVKGEVKTAIERILPKINELIESNIQQEIDGELTDVVSEITDILPSDMEELSPDELVDHLVEILQPKIEGTMRPAMETKIRDAINEVVNDKIEKPMNDKLKPVLDNLNSEAYNQVIDQMPSYIERVISKEYIRQSVKKQMESLKASVPEMISSTRTSIRSDIDKFIDNEIKQKDKVYINNTKISSAIKTKIQKNTLMGSLNETAKQLGAKTKWNLKKKTCAVTKGDKTITIDFKAGTATADGKTVKIPATFNKNNGMVPLELLATSLGFEVEKQADWNMTTIKK